ncbi:MAG: hypothetical protein IT385_19670 [Deltaproteobacteria bacterium]|nr:hypothetical protein [Deltaproteobacteria bacterium]
MTTPEPTSTVARVDPSTIVRPTPRDLSGPRPLADVRLMIATPAYGGQVTTDYMLSYLASKSALESLGARVALYTIPNESLIPRARNACLARFVAATIDGAPLTHLVFIDADIAWGPDALVRLLWLDAPLSGCGCPMKGVDFERLRDVAATGALDGMGAAELQMTSAFYALSTGDLPFVHHDFAPVHDLGTGFMCIKREVVLELVAAHPETRYVNGLADYEAPDPLGEYALGPMEFHRLMDTMIEPDTGRYLSEDYTFCRRWQAQGGVVWLDLVSEIAHVGRFVFRGRIGRWLETRGVLSRRA